MSAELPDSQTDTAFAIDIGLATDTGMLRTGNEDNLCALALPECPASAHPPVLLAVADGMGGEENGEIASRIAIASLRQHATERATAGLAPDAAWMRRTVAACNQAVVEDIIKRGPVMGTTLVLALLWDGQAWLGNVGDSRIYLLREGALKRLSRDHSLVQVLVEQGAIEDHERYTHARRNLITRSLGDPATGETDDNLPVRLAFGDCLLLCSDGLWEMVRDDAIAATLAQAPNAQAACDALVALANANGGEDNISAVVARILH